MTNQNLPNELTLPDEMIMNDDPLRAGDVVQLPYDVAFFRWIRGEANIPPETGSGAKYFGGWGCNAREADALITPLPDRFVRETFVSTDGNEYEMLTVRSFAVALIATRSRWLEEENRGHQQNLCLLAEFDREHQMFVPWGPIVLTTKGTTSMAIKDRWLDWAKMTAAARRDIAPKIPWWYFYAGIGTFGDERIQTMVGKDQHQAFVTPPQIHGAGNEITPVQLQSRFVGENTAAAMLEYKMHSQEWLDDWNLKTDEYDSKTDSSNGAPAQPESPPAEYASEPTATPQTMTTPPGDDFPPI